jgi:hypothetical protein
VLRFQKQHPNVWVQLDSGLDKRIPHRESRIAFCRNALLESIRTEVDRDKTLGLAVYLPVDLDLEIDWGILANGLRDSIGIVTSREYDGLFPVSAPRYYDIHALRAARWNSSDAWFALQRARSTRALNRFRGSFSKWFLTALFVHSRQFEAATLQRRDEPISVTSAFGGFGLYNWSAVKTRRYASTGSDACEHVAFNNGLRLAILPQLSIPAPLEHLGPESAGPRNRKVVTRFIRRWREALWRCRRACSSSHQISVLG